MTQLLSEKLFEWVHLVQAEYDEIPGLHLSKRQAQRLWNLDASTVETIFAALEAARFLRRTPNDTYIRADISY